MVVEIHGRETAAIISIERLRRLEEIEKKHRRDLALAQPRRLAKPGLESNSDLSDDEADTLVERAVREVRAEMVESGVLRFENK